MENSAQNIEISSAKLPGKISAFIFRDADHLSEEEPIYAINWFNTKSSLIYDFYNKLAVGCVRKIGGAPFFKARHIKTLYGREEDKRDVLLVVRYPALTNFRSMLESKIFQGVSVIRMAAVDNFTFGFTKRSDKGADLSPMNPDDMQEDSYGVFHYSGAADISKFLAEFNLDASVEIFYSGIIRAHIGTGEASDTATRVPCAMDGLIIFKSSDRQALEQLMDQDAFTALTTQAKGSFFGLYNRIL